MLVCEDFENGYDTSVWTPVTYNGTLDVASGRAARGDHALHIVVGTTPGSHGYLTHTSSFPVPNNEVYGRAFFNIQRAPRSRTDGQATIHWNLVEASGPAVIDGTTYHPLIRYGGIVRNHPDLDDEWYLFNYEMPGRDRPAGFAERGTGGPRGSFDQFEQKWICVEWYYGGNTSEGRFWADGVEIPELHVKGSIDGEYITMPTPFESVRIGWQHYQPISTEYEVWIDTVALHTERIGCVR